MNYTWQLTSLKRKDTTDIKNIVVQTYWKKIGTDENGNTGEFSGATPFDLSTVDANNFVKYEDLTEEIVLGWIQSVVVGSYEEHVNEKIEEQIDAKVNPVTEVTSGFPWQPEDEVTSSSPVTEPAPE
ncbi:MAG: hypothetical protein EBU90_27500 [Proteobacteria bacterium]|nr:hypothetical protein [Pseudomonadota bacterium]